MLVHLVQVAHTSGFTEQKKCICMHTLSHEEKRVWDGKSRLMNTKGPYHGISPQY